MPVPDSGGEPQKSESGLWRKISAKMCKILFDDIGERNMLLSR
jgi:hypothetical protein